MPPARRMTDLASLTTLGIGGPAARLVQPATRAELIEQTLATWNSPEDWLLLGGGSNVVIADEGFDGDVIRVATQGIGVTRAEGSRPVRLTVEAGEAWDDVVAHAVENGWSGIEALSGIPGSAGAAPVQNIGAYGQELSSSLVAIDFLDFDTEKVVRVAAAELGLGYRTSALKRGRLGLVVSLELALAEDHGLSQPIAYAQLASALNVRIGDRVPVTELRAAVLELRGAKGMLWDPGDPDSASAGSFFTNPVVTEQFARGLPADAPRWPTAPEEAARVLPLGSDIPHIVRGEYLVKLSAAWLIEKAGITRGFSIPGSRAAVSSKHTLAIVNRGGATAADVVQLAGYIQTRVLAEFGVNLQPEPVLVGVAL
jgi:UDP-N-acetylmuramate dehydrogenase